MTDLPPPPANLEPYVRVLGVELAIQFLAEFGGAELYMPRRPHANVPGRLTKLIGQEKARELTEAAEALPRRVPLGKPWIARVYKAQGLPVAEIARKLRSSDTAVRRWLKSSDDRQFSLF